MWPVDTHRLTHYVMLSSLLHLLGFAAVLWYFRLWPRTLPLPEPVRITMAAPELPAGPTLALAHTRSPSTSTPAAPVLPTVDVATPLPSIETPAPRLDPAPTQPPEVDRPLAMEPPAVAVTLPAPPVSPPAPAPAPLAVEPVALPPVEPPSPSETPSANRLTPPITAPAPVQPQRTQEEQRPPERVEVPRPPVTQPPPRPQPTVRAQTAGPAPPLTPKTPPPSTETITPAPAALQAVPASPRTTPVARRNTTPTPLTTPPPPAAKPLPLAATTPTPTPLAAAEPPPAKVSHTVTTKETTLPATPSPPSLQATPPASRLPTPPVGSSQPQDVVPTPRSARLALPSKPEPFESLPHFVYQPKPEYPLIARRRGWEGTVTLDIELRADGSVGDIKVDQSSGYPILDAVARDTVKTWQHIPVKRDGVPVTRRAQQHLVFKLD